MTSFSTKCTERLWTGLLVYGQDPTELAGRSYVLYVIRICPRTFSRSWSHPQSL